MAESGTARIWWVRARNCAIAFAALVLSIVVMKVIDARIEAGLLGVASLVAVLFLLAGLLSTYRHWQAFKDDEISRGGSAKTAQEKWHRLHPPLD